jgi:hypothetical protein
MKLLINFFPAHRVGVIKVTPTLVALMAIVLLGTRGYCQGYDQNWVTGMHEFPGQPGYHNLLLHFNASGNPTKIETDWPLNFESTTAAASDSLGHLLFFTNGCSICCADGSPMPNGDGLNPGQMHDWVCNQTGYVSPLGATALPFPGRPNQYLLLHMGARYDPVRKITLGPLYATTIDMGLNNGKGAVVTKNQVVYDGDLEPYTIVRHGNGRDWWLMCPEWQTNRYHLILISPTGAHWFMTQESGPALTCRRMGSSAFSPNGVKYGRTQNCSTVVFDFDRCSGLLSGPVVLERPANTFGGGGIAFSSDGLRLLVTTQLQVLQADLTAPIPHLDSIITWNYYWGVSLGQMQYGPNGKLYLNHLHRTKYLSVINNPDGIGATIGFQPDGVDLPDYNVRTLPNVPNYKLYDLPGSFCDTAGVNTPTAVTSPDEAQWMVEVFPNPANQVVYFKITGSDNACQTLSLFSVNGALLESKLLTRETPQTCSIHVTDWPAGIYFWRISDASGKIRYGKVLKL